MKGCAPGAIPLKKNVDDALKNPNVKSIEHVVVLKRTGGKIDWQEGRDLWWSDLIEKPATSTSRKR
jgi:acetyl-CoA synthetase